MNTYNSEVNSSEQMSYVSADGNYGSDTVLIFPYATLTEEQWETLSSMHDSTRLLYVLAVIEGKDTTEYED